jgi:hypothetical protein
VRRSRRAGERGVLLLERVEQQSTGAMEESIMSVSECAVALESMGSRGADERATERRTLTRNVRRGGDDSSQTYENKRYCGSES